MALVGAVLSLVVTAAADVRAGTLGVGVIFGEPTGVSLKSWTGRTTAIDAAAAWSFDGSGSLQFHADYLFHDFDLLRVRKGRLAVYYGIGGRVRLENKTRVGLRVPVGLDYIFDRSPLEIFVELGPVFDVVPRTEVTLAAFLGLRYLF